MLANAADANAADEPAAAAPLDAAVLAQPDNKEPTDMAPKGNMGAAANIFSAERRDDCKV